MDLGPSRQRFQGLGASRGRRTSGVHLGLARCPGVNAQPAPGSSSHGPDTQPCPCVRLSHARPPPSPSPGSPATFGTGHHLFSGRASLAGGLPAPGLRLSRDTLSAFYSGQKEQQSTFSWLGAMNLLLSRRPGLVLLRGSFRFIGNRGLLHLGVLAAVAVHAAALVQSQLQGVRLPLGHQVLRLGALQLPLLGQRAALQTGGRGPPPVSTSRAAPAPHPCSSGRLLDVPPLAAPDTGLRTRLELS